MLERIGGECAGAVSLLPEDAPPPTAGEMRVRELSGKELEDIIGELPRRPLMAGREGLRLSLAGSQPKLPVLIRNDTLAIPLGNTPSTHIIKPEPARSHHGGPLGRHHSRAGDIAPSGLKMKTQPPSAMADFMARLRAQRADWDARGIRYRAASFDE